MKILAGKLKGRNFFMPFGIRPTQNLTRKAIFDILGQDMEGLTVLDLFAGSGSIGLEALSRGAERVIFVEKNAKCYEVIGQNLELLGYKNEYGLDEQVDVLQADSFALIKSFARANKKFHLVFLDAPYSLGLTKKALKTLMAYDIVQPNYYVVAEHSKRDFPGELDERFQVITVRKYGKSYLTVIQVR